MERQGFHRMTMQDLANEAGVSVGMAYDYFTGKDEILLAVIVDIIDAYRRELPLAMAVHKDPVARLAAGYEAYCRVIDRHILGAVLAYRESKTLDPIARARVKELELETTKLLADTLREGQKAGLFVDFDPMLVAYDLTITAHMWALKHWYFRRRLSIYQFIQQQLSFFFKALIKPEVIQKYQVFLDQKHID
jgi:AcrR family transcriptional regulator